MRTHLTKPAYTNRAVHLYLFYAAPPTATLRQSELLNDRDAGFATSVLKGA